MKCTRWAVVLCLSVSVVMVIQGRAAPPAGYERYEQTDEYDKYIMENGLTAGKGDVNSDLADLFDELSNGVGDVDRNAYQNGDVNERPPFHGPPPRFPPPRPGNADRLNHMSERIMNSLYQSFGGPAIRSMIEQYTRSGYPAGGDVGGDDGECCKYDAYTIIPGFVLVAVSYLLLILLNATVTGGKRRRRDLNDDADRFNEIDNGNP